MNKFFSFMALLLIVTCSINSTLVAATKKKSALIIGHECTDISKIPEKYLDKARKEFKVWYGHTSHGSQITSGMQAMNKGAFSYSKTEKKGALLYQEVRGDLGHKGDLRWMEKTRKQLENPNNKSNFVMWSWCGGCSRNTDEGIKKYLEAMTKLEKDYQKITFVYMTGHLDGSGEKGNLHKTNEQIRKYCKEQKKILFDFADIESFAPNGKTNFLKLKAKDTCDYDKDGDGKRESNWCKEWLAKNPKNKIALPKRASHTQPLNGALKGRAFWWMIARLSGWDGK